MKWLKMVAKIAMKHFEADNSYCLNYEDEAVTRMKRMKR